MGEPTTDTIFKAFKSRFRKRRVPLTDIPGFEEFFAVPLSSERMKDVISHMEVLDREDVSTGSRISGVLKLGVDLIGDFVVDATGEVRPFDSVEGRAFLWEEVDGDIITKLRDKILEISGVSKKNDGED